MNPIGALILTFLCFIVFSAPRRYALLGMMAGVLYLTQGLQVQVAGFNLFAIRFLELAGFIRVLSRREFTFSRLNRIDRSLLLLYGYITIVYVLRSNEGIAYQIGVAVDAFLCYFTFRGLIASQAEFRQFLRSFVFLLIPYVAILLVERIAHQNLFAIIGATSGGEWLRDGKVRCIGSFRHPSLLGTLGASFLPCYIGLSLSSEDRKLSIAAIILCLAVVLASNSGGPLNAAAVGFVGWGFWLWRTKMKIVRRGMALLIIVLAMVMKAPVWYLIAKISSLTGGDGWHRSYLLDMAAQHFSNWWFAGIPIQETSDWFPYIIVSTGGSDITNQFVSFGLTAGVVAIILFNVLLVRTYSSLGRAMAVIRNGSALLRSSEYMFWGLGVALTVHIVNWFGITYFDQTYVIWFMQLAVISTLSTVYLEKESLIPEVLPSGEARELSSQTVAISG